MALTHAKIECVTLSPLKSLESNFYSAKAIELSIRKKAQKGLEKAELIFRLLIQGLRIKNEP